MPDDPTQDFGASLRQAREKAGVTLRQIATNTKISILVLEALERGDASRLPGGIFSRAFVRAYAKEVGLDPEATVRRFVAKFPDESFGESPAPYDANPERIVVDDEPSAGRLRRSIWWGVPIVLVVLYFGFGGRLSWWRSAPPAAAPPPAATAAASPATGEKPVLSAPVETPPPASGSATAGAQALQTSAAQETQASTVDPQAASQPALRSAEQTPAATPGEGAAAVPPEGSFRLSLAPRAACWVTVRVDHKIVFTGTLQAGERKDLTVWGLVSFTVGNAGAMAFSINDQPGRSLGADGQVTTALITAQNLKTFLETR